jgi:hypothetical protein
VIESAISRHLDPSHLRLDYRRYGKIISALEPFLGQSGWLEVSKLTVQSLETEEFVILSATDDQGNTLDTELCQKLLSLPAAADGPAPNELPAASLETIRATRIQENLQRVSERNGKHFDEEVAKLDNWAEDLKFGLERDIKELDKSIREARKQSAIAISLQDKLEAQKSMKAFEASRSRKRKELFESQDKIDQQRDDLITRIEKQMQHTQAVKPLFTVRWTLAG